MHQIPSWLVVTLCVLRLTPVRARQQANKSVSRVRILFLMAACALLLAPFVAYMEGFAGSLAALEVSGAAPSPACSSGLALLGMSAVG